MAEVTNELIYEVLRSMQARLGNVDEGLREVRGEVRALREGVNATNGQLGAIHLDIANLYEAYGTLDSRVARIEHRLDIIDTPSL
jgi:chromosome segregation ATPase